jgi:hypothetical protein
MYIKFKCTLQEYWLINEFTSEMCLYFVIVFPSCAVCNGGGGGLSEIYITWSFASTPPGRLHGVMLGTRVIVCLINELVHQCDAFVTYFDQIWTI